MEKRKRDGGQKGRERSEGGLKRSEDKALRDLHDRWGGKAAVRVQEELSEDATMLYQESRRRADKGRKGSGSTLSSVFERAESTATRASEIRSRDHVSSDADKKKVCCEKKEKLYLSWTRSLEQQNLRSSSDPALGRP